MVKLSCPGKTRVADASGFAEGPARADFGIVTGGRASLSAVGSRQHDEATTTTVDVNPELGT